ncbi:hypothetical protein BH20ACI2_BH20ACI2_01570 [soil metagenome]
MKIERDGFIISTDKALLDIDAIHEFLSVEAYWATNRTREKTQRR